VLTGLAAFIARNLPFVAQVALMGLEMTGLARPNSPLVWADPADYQRELAEAVDILAAAGITTRIYNHQLCVLDRSLWPYAVRSISDSMFASLSRTSCERCERYTSSMTKMTTLKVSVQTRDRLKKLADEDQLTMDGELARTLDKAEEARFWEGVRADYARLQADPQEWADYVSEVAEWDHAVGDGLDDE